MNQIKEWHEISQKGKCSQEIRMETEEMVGIVPYKRIDNQTNVLYGNKSIELIHYQYKDHIKNGNTVIKKTET